MNAEVIDPLIFSEISALMEESLPIFIETYLENTQKLLDKLEQAVPAGDSEGVFQHAHQLKGGSGSIGAMQVFQIAQQMEEVTKGVEADVQLSTLFVALKDAYVTVEAELKTRL